MSNFIIKITNLTKQFYSARGLREFFSHPLRPGKKIVALDSVNLEIPEGTIFSLLGPNGAGKTTLIKILCSLILPTRGRISVNGYDVFKDEIEVKKSVGLVSGEERSFYWRLTGRENLHFFAALAGLSAKQTKEKIAVFSRVLCFEDFLDRRFQEYSSGIKQRLSIARSLFNNPKIIFFDEPTKSLDPKSAEELHQFISGKLVKEQGKTVVYSTHQLDEAEHLSDYIGIIAKGQIKAFGTLNELGHKFQAQKVFSLKKLYNHFTAAEGD